MKTIILYGLRRSGNHFLISTILQQFSNYVHMNNMNLSYNNYIKYRNIVSLFWRNAVRSPQPPGSFVLRLAVTERALDYCVQRSTHQLPDTTTGHRCAQLYLFVGMVVRVETSTYAARGVSRNRRKDGTRKEEASWEYSRIAVSHSQTFSPRRMFSAAI